MTAAMNISDIIETGSFTSAEAMEIDANLSQVQVHQIPDHQVSSMIDYINFRILHDAIMPDVKVCLEKLQTALAERLLSD